MERVDVIAQEYLCCSCGACSVVCPLSAIQFEETTGGYVFPVINEDRCADCGQCASVCPGLHFGESLMTRMPDDPFVGEFEECFIGRAADDGVFERSQSGGVVTALLLDALSGGRIGAALVTVMRSGSRPRPVARLATSADGIIAAQKSKYSPVSLLQALRESRDEALDIGVVGLPCHLHGLYNVLDLYPSLGHRIKFKIGLICDRIMTSAAIDYLIGLASFQGEPDMLHFRDKAAGGYPGSVRILGTEGSDTVLSASWRFRVKDALTPARCRLCFDKMNVFADVTVGDPWGLSDADLDKGESVLVCRTRTGTRAVERAVRGGALVLRSISYDEVLKGQGIDMRRRNWRGYSSAWRDLGFDMPDYWARVVRHAGLEGKEGCRADLEHSLSLDKFDSRDELLQHIGEVACRKRIRQPLSFIYRLVCGAKKGAEQMLTRFYDSVSEEDR